jgi:hypothetical protein
MTDEKPSRVYVLGVYLKRFIRWKRISWPYLSVDAFSKLADVHVFAPRYFTKKPSENEIRSAGIIFCPSDRLQEFLDQYKGLIAPKVIISGNSDFEFHEEPKNIPSSVQKLLLQNSYISDNTRIFTMPIGIENFRFGVNGNPRNISYSKISPGSRGKILLGPFGDTHPIRKQIQETLQNAPENFTLLRERITPRNYNRLVRDEYEYIACVRGNGVDTHRLWESLYRGRKPIVYSDKWLESLQFLTPHVARLEEWDVEHIRDSISADISDFNPLEVPELWMPFWKNLVSSWFN